MKLSLFIVLSFIFTGHLYSQALRAKNIHYRIIDEKIEIFYDLPINSDSIDVKIVFLKKSAPKFKYNPLFISGDVGIGIFSGTNKKIVWDYLNEPDHLFTGSGFYFKITATIIPKREEIIQE